MDMSADFTLLTPVARQSPETHVPREAEPHEPRRNQPPRSTDSMVRSCVEEGKELMTELNRNEWAKTTCRGNTK